MKADLDALVHRYKSEEPTLTERQKAEIEALIWTLTPDRSVARREYMQKLLGGPSNDYDQRQQLFRVGPAANPLWERISKKEMSLRTATRILSAAKDRSRHGGGELALLILKAVQEYDALPFASRMSNGTLVRKKAIDTSTHWHHSETFSDTPPEDERLFWKWMRDVIMPFVQKKLTGVDPIVSTQLLKTFEVDLKNLLSELANRIYKAANFQKHRQRESTLIVVRDAVREACLALSLDPPVWGRPADLVKAQKQKRKLAQLYHPDLHGGDDRTRPQYERVIEAFNVLERYNQQLSTSGEESNGGSDGGR